MRDDEKDTTTFTTSTSTTPASCCQASSSPSLCSSSSTLVINPQPSLSSGEGQGDDRGEGQGQGGAESATVTATTTTSTNQNFFFVGNSTFHKQNRLFEELILSLADPGIFEKLPCKTTFIYTEEDILQNTLLHIHEKCPEMVKNRNKFLSVVDKIVFGIHTY